MKPINTIIILLLWGLGLACTSWDLEPQELFTVLQLNVAASPPGDTAIGRVELSAVIRDWQSAPIDAHGFVWVKEGSGTPNLLFFDDNEPLGIRTKEQGDTFQYTVTNLDPGTAFTFVAYVTIDGRTFYSPATSVTTNTGRVFTDSLVYQGGDALQVFGHLLGTNQGLVAVEHGFCWSSVNPEPTLANDFVNLGTRRDDNSFRAEIKALEDDQSFFIRAYAKLSFDLSQEPEVVYGEVLLFDGNLNFWAQAATWPGGGNPRGWPAHFVINEELYFCSGFDLVQPAVNYLWKFNGTGTTEETITDPDTQEPVTVSLPGSWERLAVTFPGNSDGFYGFAINGKGYVGGGANQGKGNVDFYSYDPATSQFTKATPPPIEHNCGRLTDKEPSRTGGVSFAIGGKGYIGLGLLDYSACSNRPRLRDLWEFDPTQETMVDGEMLAGKWTRKADFPIANQPFVHPVNFVINGKGYVAGGDGGVHTSFFEFDPTDTSNGFDENGNAMGKWTQRANFPAGPRERVAGFSIGEKGYVGIGRNAWYRTDFWEYDPGRNGWTRKAEFPGPVRIDGFGFAIGGKGYLGFGQEPKGPRIADFWVFTP